MLDSKCNAGNSTVGLVQLSLYFQTSPGENGRYCTVDDILTEIVLKSLKMKLYCEDLWCWTEEHPIQT